MVAVLWVMAVVFVLVAQRNNQSQAAFRGDPRR
jgi:hypothetical protein